MLGLNKSTGPEERENEERANKTSDIIITLTSFTLLPSLIRRRRRIFGASAPSILSLSSSKSMVITSKSHHFDLVTSAILLLSNLFSSAFLRFYDSTSYFLYFTFNHRR
ncbi:unnamed protein product [Citrullus colocynthis]|uniref:Uncharacterized protein n=1 Tax=Citrullus colocynthis TaxID=252529 RepID=A0ABP0XU51_9ROSI